MIKNTTIIPFEGIDFFKLKMNFDDIIAELDKTDMQYNIEILDNSKLTHKEEWKIIHLNNVLNLFFVKDKMFKIDIGEGYNGSLPNGIKTGVLMDEAKKLDDTLRFNDWEEDWESSCGYWLEDNITTGKVTSITIFIKELADENEFYKYEWI